VPFGTTVNEKVERQMLRSGHQKSRVPSDRGKKKKDYGRSTRIDTEESQQGRKDKKKNKVRGEGAGSQKPASGGKPEKRTGRVKGHLEVPGED